jgi:S1-C subfamily serine protease
MSDMHTPDMEPQPEPLKEPQPEAPLEAQFEPQPEARPEPQPDRPDLPLFDAPQVAPPEGASLLEPPSIPEIPGPPPRHGRKAVAAILAGLVLLSAGVGIGWSLSRHGSTVPTTGAKNSIQVVPQTSPSNTNPSATLDLQAIANLVDPAIVDINTVVDAIGGQVGSKAAGTGMVLTSTGEVLTNNHVIAGATSITVTVQGSGSSYSATVIGVDPVDDIALIQIQGVSGLPTVTLADSSSVTIGQSVVAIGNALGRGGTPAITAGAIASLDRTITVADDTGSPKQLAHLMQAEVQISPGDSGGALVNESGQVLGMITAAARSGGPERVSQVAYAIPVNTAVGIVNQIRSGQGSSNILLGERGFLGVAAQDLDSASAARLGLSITSGVLISGIVPGTPAAAAKIPSGAVITAIDGVKVSSVEELGKAIYLHEPGDKIQVSWIDTSGSHTATATLIAGPAV